MRDIYWIMERMGNVATEHDAQLVLDYLNRHNLNEDDLLEIYEAALKELNEEN